jgi:hypothetical protein
MSNVIPITGENWSDWLSVDRCVERYGMAKASVYKLKSQGVRWAKPPLVGLVFYRPDIDALIERHVPEVARKLHALHGNEQEDT